ncbi:MAG: hypothetical protein CMB99_02370 [Flavobacteriaceae bacterium]|nr:hypothetical protein [Flavobacteriaceae bacterium]|tara:strand:+ start:39620 stop:40297 length:678 start_codon:yes stop_codon:yes gene_type:complete
MKKSIFLFFFVAFSINLSAQVYEIGVFLGGSNYVGDIGRTNYVYPNNLAGAVFFKYNYNPKIAFRATYSYLPIQGNDLEAATDLKINRGLNFKNTINELALGLEYNFYEYNIAEEGKTWTPYILLELAAFSYKHAVAEPVPFQYEFQSKTSFTAPIGVGFKSKLVDNLAFAIEAKFRYTFEDDLDYTTTTIPNLNFGGNGKDWYMFTGVSFIYTFGRPPCYTNGF